MLRRTPLKTRTRINPRREKPRRTLKVRDQAHKDKIKLLPCCAPGAPAGCWGPIDPSHTGARGLGQKADDTSCVPHCRGHHDQWENHHGVFAGWTREQRREWAACEAARAQAMVAAPLPDWA